MIKILFAALILGCFIADISSQRNEAFEFHDSHGRCWRCLPGSSCIRCPSNQSLPRHRAGPSTWDRTCQKPSISICTTNPGARFPSRCMNYFYQCGENGQSIRVPCTDPEMVFDMRQQGCVPSDQITSVGCDNYLEPGTPCPSDDEVTTTTTTTTNGPITTTSTTMPGDTTTTTTKDPSITTTTTSKPPGDTTTTTTTTTTPKPPTPSPGPDLGTTTTTEGPSTNPPCVCVIWWPCACNPCWRMPCHSCNGCVGMMG